MPREKEGDWIVISCNGEGLALHDGTIIKGNGYTGIILAAGYVAVKRDDTVLGVILLSSLIQGGAQIKTLTL